MFEKELIKIFKENYNNIDLVKKEFEAYEFLTFDKFCKNFKEIYNIWDNNTEVILMYLFVKFIKRNSSKGLGILDPNSKYNNIYFDYVFNKCNNFINSPYGVQKVGIDLIKESWNEDEEIGLKNLLFTSPYSKYKRLKYFDKFGDGYEYAKYNKNINVIKQTLELLLEDNFRKTNFYDRYFINFNSCLDVSKLQDLYGIEFYADLLKCVTIINVENIKELKITKEILQEEKNKPYDLEKYLVTFSKIYNLYELTYETN